MTSHMAEHVRTRSGADVRHTSSVSKHEELNADLVIKAMKKVSHRDPDGYLVIPKYYDDDDDDDDDHSSERSP